MVCRRERCELSRYTLDALRRVGRIRRAVRPMKTEDRRVCPSCGNEFSGAVEFCPVLRNFDVQDCGESGFSWRLSPIGAPAPNWRMKSRKQRVCLANEGDFVHRLPTRAEWLYEVKWDGYPALAPKHGDSVRWLRSRTRI
jgi:hypothetical protein